jgi:A/G-specific adenine glycosylase
LFPKTFSELKTLPGIGDYTAAAIASIAFGESVAVVDGNVFRVLARIFGIDLPINSPEGKKQFTSLANKLIDGMRPDLHNQAVMEFGALHCTPQNPKCDECVFKRRCFAFKKNLQNDLPVKLKSKASRKRHFYYFAIQQGKSFLMKKRDHKDIWHGLYDFHLVEKNRPEDIQALIREDVLLRKAARKLQIVKISKAYKHVLSHQVIHATFIWMKADSTLRIPYDMFEFYSTRKIATLPKSVLITRFLNDELIL